MKHDYESLASDRLDVAEGLAHEQKSHRAEHVARGALYGVVVLAIAGLFGPGPLSSAAVASPDGSLTIAYHRFVRHDAPAQLTFRVPASEVGADSRLVSFSPEPRSARSEGERVVYTINVTPGAEASFQITYRPRVQGLKAGSAGRVGGPSLETWHFIYP
jgi:hypothetical protein